MTIDSIPKLKLPTRGGRKVLSSILPNNRKILIVLDANRLNYQTMNS